MRCRPSRREESGACTCRSGTPIPRHPAVRRNTPGSGAPSRGTERPRRNSLRQCFPDARRTADNPLVAGAGSRANEEVDRRRAGLGHPRRDRGAARASLVLPLLGLRHRRVLRDPASARPRRARLDPVLRLGRDVSVFPGDVLRSSRSRRPWRRRRADDDQFAGPRPRRPRGPPDVPRRPSDDRRRPLRPLRGRVPRRRHSGRVHDRAHGARHRRGTPRPRRPPMLRPSSDGRSGHGAAPPRHGNAHRDAPSVAVPLPHHGPRDGRRPRTRASVALDAGREAGGGVRERPLSRHIRVLARVRDDVSGVDPAGCEHPTVVGVARPVPGGPPPARWNCLCTSPPRVAVSAKVSGAPPSGGGVCRGRGHDPRNRRGLGRHRSSGDDVSCALDRAPLLCPAGPPSVVRGMWPPVQRFPPGWAQGQQLARRPPRFGRRGDRRGAARPDSVPTHGVPDDSNGNLRGNRVLPPAGPRGPSRWETDAGPRDRWCPPRRQRGRGHPTSLDSRGLAGGDDSCGIGPRVLGAGLRERTRRVGPSRIHHGFRIRRSQRNVGPNAGSVLDGLRKRLIRRALGHSIAFGGEKRHVHLDRPGHGGRRPPHAVGDGHSDGPGRHREVRRCAVHQALRQRLRAALLDRVGLHPDHVLSRTLLWPATASRRSMRVAVLHDHLRFIGGGERVALTLAAAFDADLYVTDLDPTLPERAGMRTVRATEIARVPRSPPMRQDRQARAFREVAIPDHDVYILSGNCAVFAAPRFRPNVWYCHTPVRVFYDLHDSILASLPGVRRWAARRWIDRRRPEYETAWAAVQVVVANSRNVADRIERFLRRKAEVVYPPVDTSRYRFGHVGDSWLAVSRLSHEKRLQLLVETFRRLPRERLVVVGGPQLGLDANRLVRSLDPPANVDFVGEIPEAKLLDRYATCRGLVATSEDEDFGLTPVEAMAAGKAVVAVDEGGYRETIVPGETGWLVPPTAAALASAISSTTVADLERIRASCVARAAAFDTRIFVDGMRTIVRSAVEGADGR